MNLVQSVAYELDLLMQYIALEPVRAKTHRVELMALLDRFAVLQAECEAERIDEREARERLSAIQQERRKWGITLLSMKEVA